MATTILEVQPLSSSSLVIGIDPARQAEIFERFERAVADRHYGGLGLGLYISRRIAEAHGGVIRVESALGARATFTVELPYAKRANGEPADVRGLRCLAAGE